MTACIIFNPDSDESRLHRIETVLSLLYFRVDAIALAPEYKIREDFLGGKAFIAKDEQHALVNSDVVICLGGDGTVIYTVHMLAKYDLLNKPVISINLGNVGFICPFSYEDVLKGLDMDMDIQERSLLELKTGAARQPTALNEIYIGKPDIETTVLTFKISFNDQVATFRGDGVILATSTGSTAYNFSMGGPIISPERGANLVCITPTGCIDASVKPIVMKLDPLNSLTIETSEESCVQCDSRTIGYSKNHEVEASLESLFLKTPKSFNYFDLLEKKLGWGRLSK
jgi:NAD+ kinase